jgi:hypothetical protein
MNLRLRIFFGFFSISFVLSSCSPGQLAGPTLTPTPTSKPTQTATATIKPTLTPFPTFTPKPTPAFITILGKDYAQVPPPDGETTADRLAYKNGFSRPGTEYIYTIIDNQTYLVDTFNGERDMVWQNNVWLTVKDAGTRFGYLLKPGDATPLNNETHIINAPELANILWKNFIFCWTGNTKIVHINDPVYVTNYPNGINYLAIQVVARLGDNTNGKFVSLWLAVAQDKSTSINPQSFVHLNGKPQYTMVDSESLLLLLGKPGEKPLNITIVLNPSLITTPYKLASICDKEVSTGPTDWSPPELCRIQFDQTKPFEEQLKKINNGTITQEELDQIGFLAITSPLDIWDQ